MGHSRSCPIQWQLFPIFGRQVSTQSFAAGSEFPSALFHVHLGISRQFLRSVFRAQMESGRVWFAPLRMQVVVTGYRTGMCRCHEGCGEFGMSPSCMLDITSAPRINEPTAWLRAALQPRAAQAPKVCVCKPRQNRGFHPCLQAGM